MAKKRKPKTPALDENGQPIPKPVRTRTMGTIIVQKLEGENWKDVPSQGLKDTASAERFVELAAQGGDSFRIIREVKAYLNIKVEIVRKVQL